MLTAKTRLRLLPPLILRRTDVANALAILDDGHAVTDKCVMEHLLKLGSMTPDEIIHILDVADEYKRLHKAGTDPKDLQGKAVALILASIPPAPAPAWRSASTRWAALAPI